MPRAACALLLVLFLTANDRSLGEDLAIPIGRGSFVFADRQGDPDRPVTVYTYRPRAYTAESPILIVLHGRERNGEAYRDDWERYARQYACLLLVPCFREAYYPGSSQYQLGGICTTTLLSALDIPDWVALCRVLADQAARKVPGASQRLWECLGAEARKQIAAIAAGNAPDLDTQEAVLLALNEILGRSDFYQEDAFPKPILPREARALLGTPAKDISLSQVRWLNRLLLDDAYPQLLHPFRYQRRTIQLWTYSLVEHLCDHVCKGLGSRQTSYLLYGHSAGAQFVQRFLLFRPDARIAKAVAANAGRYAVAAFDVAWPYGMKDSGCPAIHAKRALSRPLVVLAGSDDTDTDDDDLTTTAAAMKQGKNRLERARYFMDSAKAEAAKQRVELAWEFQVVPDAGHDNTQMAKAAAPLLLETKRVRR